MEGDERSAAGGAYWGVGVAPCDACAGEAARLYCRADEAFLCVGCDARAHGARSRHARVWLCEVCEHAPASVTCRADAAALCASCDADIHAANPLARRHERLPVAPFFGALADAPRSFASSARAGSHGVAAGAADADDDGSNEAEAASWLLPEPDHGQKDDAADAFYADSDSYLDLDFARSMDDIKAISVLLNGPPEHDLAAGAKVLYSDHSMNHSMSSSEAGVVPDTATGAAQMPAVVCRGREREARLMRYREKRKSRRFQKTIRYASRKAYAETRPRIKGRFAKRTSGGAGPEQDTLEEQDGDMYSSAAAAVAALIAPAADGDYGVVPTF